MTDNEIIKALECCQYEGVKTCRDCPMFYTHEFDNEIDFDCGKYIYGRALDLINRQKDKIERLNIELQSMRSAANSYKMHYETAKSEAIKEFAERLKEKLQWDVEFDNKLVFESDIDNLVKEMTE